MIVKLPFVDKPVQLDPEKRKLLEPGPGFGAGIRDLRFNPNNVSSFLVSLIFSLSGAVVVFVNVASKANFTQQQAVSWIASAYVISGIISMLLDLYYKIPILAMPTITGMLVMGPTLKLFSVSELVIGYIIAALACLLLGVSGLIGKYAKYIPLPIIMGMIAGVFMSYGTAVVTSVKALPLIGIATMLAYLITPQFTKKIPQQAVAVAVAVVLTLVFVPLQFKTGTFAYFFPTFVMPHFNPSVIVSVSLPLTLVVIADLLKSYGVLKANGYEPPLNSLIIFPSGIGSLLGSVFLAPTLSMTGPITAILSDPSAGPRESRYVGGVLKNFSSIAIGILAGLLVPFLMKLPSSVSSILAGLAMVGLFINSLGVAFGSKKFSIGALTAFVVALANLELWGISSAVWALFFGVAVSLFLERDHFKLEGITKAGGLIGEPLKAIGEAPVLPSGRNH